MTSTGPERSPHGDRPTWRDRLLTTDSRQRIRLFQCATASALMLISAMALGWLAWIGMAPAVPVMVWALISVPGMAAFFFVVRSGANLRFAEPSLTLPQILFALASSAVAYGLAGRGRGAVFPILMLILMFGMYSLRPGQVRRASLMGVLMIGGVMAWMVWRRPDVYEPTVEVVHFVMVGVMLPAVAFLAGQLSNLRDRLERQKIELAEALIRIREMASHDELTGLFNRRYMMAQLEQEHARHARAGHTFCAALIDIDHFKRVNDAHGHAAGDDVLRGLAATALAELRDADVLARWGGEEFLVLLPNTPVDLARTGAERVRAKVARAVFPAGVLSLTTTVSVGLTEYRPQESVSQFVERADQALYEAKAQGRNRVVVA